MVATHVKVYTRSHLKGSTGFLWESDGYLPLPSPPDPLHTSPGGRRPRGAGAGSPHSQVPREVGTYPREVGTYPREVGTYPRGVGYLPSGGWIPTLGGLGTYPRGVGTYPRGVGYLGRQVSMGHAGGLGGVRCGALLF